MADGSAPAVLTLVPPMVQDFAYLAQHMREDEKQQFVAMTGADSFRADVAARAYVMTPGTSWAMIDAQGRALFAGGFEPLRPGVYAAWMIGTPEAWAAHWHAVTRRVRKLMDALFADGAHRIELQTLATRVEACRWYVDGLGLQYEGTHFRACADGQDVRMYARTQP